RHAGLGDRLHPAAAQTKGPLVPLLAVGPGPQAVRRTGSCPQACAARLGRHGARAPGVARGVPVRASGEGDPTDTAGSERVNVACSGAGPGAAVPGGIGRRALRVVRIADAGARSGAAPEGLGGGAPRSARAVVRASGECAWVPFEAAGHRPGPFGVDVTAEAAEDSVLAEAGARAHSGAAGEGLDAGRAEPAPRTLRVHGAHGARVGAAHAVILTS